MSNKQQDVSYHVHLNKAKRAVNFILILSLITLIPSFIFFTLDWNFFTSVTTFIVLLFTTKYIYKYPIIGVTSLGLMILLYSYGWFKFLAGINVRNHFGMEAFQFYLILGLRILATLIVIWGFYFAIKGMNAKEQFEKKYETLDEDEI